MKRVVLLLLSLFLVVSCTGPTTTPTPLPPTEEEPEIAPTVVATIPQVATLPPVWTPTSLPPTATTIPTAVPSTPTVAVSPTIAPEVTESTPEGGVDATLASPVGTTDCAEFRPDLERTGESFSLGDGPTLYWVPFAHAVTYRVRIYDPEGAIILTESVPGELDQFTLPVELFEEFESYIRLANVGVFTWDAIPMGLYDLEFCDLIGGELVFTIGVTGPPTPTQANNEGEGEGG